MIVVDTSALMEILLQQPRGAACQEQLQDADALCISAGSLTEALIVASHRNLHTDLDSLIEQLHVEVIPVSALTAGQCAAAHLQWGKGVHPAGLNFGDCFAYALAKSRNCPLLFVGDDFSQTDIVSAI